MSRTVGHTSGTVVHTVFDASVTSVCVCLLWRLPRCGLGGAKGVLHDPLLQSKAAGELSLPRLRERQGGARSSSTRKRPRPVPLAFSILAGLENLSPSSHCLGRVCRLESLPEPNLYKFGSSIWAVLMMFWMLCTFKAVWGTFQCTRFRSYA